MKTLLAVLLLFFTSAVAAQSFAPPPPPPPPPAPVPDVPPAPPGLQSGQVMEPGVRIIQTENETIFEYRSGNHLYMVKVVPRSGPPYYFYDTNGDGQLDFEENDPRTARVNMWELFRW